MDASRFDRITQLFAERRLSRRQAVTVTTATAAATAIGAGPVSAAQDATPQATPVTDEQLGSYDKTTYLFVQSFQSGSLTPNTDNDRHTLKLEHGLGQTIYFGDRPSREVGVTPTSQFLDGLGFTADNPPNAALIVETGDDDADLAVLELFEPTYDAATYQVRGLETWQDTLHVGLQEEPTDVAAMAPAFEAAHLLIDDCANASVDCYNTSTQGWVASYDNLGFCYNYAICMPCDPYGHNQPDKCSTLNWWGTKCAQDHESDCGGNCFAEFGGSIFLGC